MNGNKTPLYIGFVLMFVGFFVLLNSYWLLKSDVKINQEKINQLQQTIDKQSKPCQAEDLLYPDRSAGCTIPSSTPDGSSVTPTTPKTTAPQTTTPQAQPTSPTSAETPPPSTTPVNPQPPPQSMLPGDQEPIFGCILGICI